MNLESLDLYRAYQLKILHSSTISIVACNLNLSNRDESKSLLYERKFRRKRDKLQLTSYEQHLCTQSEDCSQWRGNLKLRMANLQRNSPLSIKKSQSLKHCHHIFNYSYRVKLSILYALSTFQTVLYNGQNRP